MHGLPLEWRCGNPNPLSEYVSGVGLCSIVLSSIWGIVYVVEDREEDSVPYVIKKFDKKYYIVNRKTGKRKNKVGYKTMKEALKILAALRANVEEA